MSLCLELNELNMIQKKFGNSEIDLSVMGLGLAALGRPGYINLGHGDDLQHTYDEAQMASNTHVLLDLARQSGVNYFDAAQSYGKAEVFLSSWLRQNRDPDVNVGSKWGYYYTADWSVNAEHHEIKEHTVDRLNQQWPESESRLKPNLMLYQIHSATFESGILENTEVLERLEEIRQQGYIIGLSLSGTRQAAVLEAALKIKIDDQPLFGSVQATYNSLEQSAGAMLRKAHDLGVGVIVKEGVANGRLTSRNQQANYIRTLSDMARDYQVGVDAIALAYILSKPFVNVVLSGAAKETHLVENLKAAELTLSSNDVQKLDQLAMPPAVYWDERKALSWN